MKYLLTTAFCLITVIGFSQISHFKTINTADLSSNPSQFTTYNGEVYFLTQNKEYQELWKVDSSGSHLSKVIDKPVHRSQSFGNVQDLFTGPDGLYFIVKNGELLNTQYFLYRTNGQATDAVAHIPSPGKIYFAGGNLFMINGSDLYQIQNGETNLIYRFLNGMPVNYIPQIINDDLYFFDYLQQPNATFSLLTFIANKEGYQSVFRIDSVIDSGNYQNSGIETAVLNNELFIISNKLNNETLTVQIQLQKFSSGQLTFLRNIGSHPLNQFYNRTKINNFKEVADKLLFIHDRREFWISDGTVQGTSLIKTFSDISIDIFNYSIAEIDGHYFFGAADANDAELWQSDGTTSGTVLLMDLDSVKSSTPHYFRRLGDNFIFRTAADEVWISDGTNSGTTKIGKMPRPIDSQFNFYEVPEFALTSDSVIIYKNYSEETGYECWRTDGSISGTYILKNVFEGKTIPLLGSERIMLDSVWYFNGVDEQGSELWRSDGTPEGTYRVIDLVPGSGNLNIRSMVKTDSLLFFTAYAGKEGILRLFRSNGLESGTFEIILESGFPYTPSVSNLTPAGGLLYFIFSTTSGKSLWRSDGSQEGTEIVDMNSTAYSSNPLEGFNDGRLFLGINSYPLIIDSTGIIDTLDNQRYYPSQPINWKGDVYFINKTNQLFKIAKGTFNVTELVDYSPELYGTNYVHLIAKTDSFLYFSGAIKSNIIDIWRTDGTSVGTIKTGEIPIGNANVENMNLIGVGNQVFLLFYSYTYPTYTLNIWTGNGSLGGTSEVYKFENAYAQNDFTIIDSTLYFSFYSNKYGAELWRSNGTGEGTFLVQEIRQGSANSHTFNFMGFNNKIIFTALTDTAGYAFFQYHPTICEGNRNYAIKSGFWKDPSNWSCGSVPNEIDYAIIEAPYKLELLPKESVKIANLLVKPGAVLEFPSSSKAVVNPKE